MPYKIKKITKFLLLVFSIVLSLLVFSTYKIYNQASKFCSKQISSKYTEKVKDFSRYLEKYKPEEKVFLSYDKVPLSGLLFYKPNAKKVILIAHGYRGSKEFLAPLIDLFNNENIFIFDFRAHGLSESNRITFGNLESSDVKAAIDLISKDPRISNLPIFGIGLSMGAVALIKAACEGNKFKGLVLDSGYADFKEQAENWIKKTSNLPLFVIRIGLIFYQFFYDGCFRNLNFANIISKVKTPILIIHSTNDEITPVSNAYELYNKASGQKELWILNDAKHALIYDKYPHEYKKKVEDFFDRT